MRPSPIVILNTIACAALRRRHVMDPLSLAWAESRGLDVSSLQGLVGPFGRRTPIDEWEAHSIAVRNGRFVADPSTSDPAAWTDGPRISLSARIGDEARIRGGWIILETMLPETVIAMLPGTDVASLVELPLDFDAPIRQARPTDEGVQLGFDHQWIPLPGRSRMRDPGS